MGPTASGKTAAALALDGGLPVQAVPYARLREQKPSLDKARARPVEAANSADSEKPAMSEPRDRPAPRAATGYEARPPMMAPAGLDTASTGRENSSNGMSACTIAYGRPRSNTSRRSSANQAFWCSAAASRR